MSPSLCVYIVGVGTIVDGVHTHLDVTLCGSMVEVDVGPFSTTFVPTRCIWTISANIHEVVEEYRGQIRLVPMEDDVHVVTLLASGTCRLRSIVDDADRVICRSFKH